MSNVFDTLRGTFNAVRGALSFNASTLSGAVDIIVVRDDSGVASGGSVVYRSTPWQIRFGKLKLLKAERRTVEIRVNGKRADFVMKLGQEGEGCFLIKTPIEAPVAIEAGTDTDEERFTVHEVHARADWTDDEAFLSPVEDPEPDLDEPLSPPPVEAPSRPALSPEVRKASDAAQGSPLDEKSQAGSGGLFGWLRGSSTQSKPLNPPSSDPRSIQPSVLTSPVPLHPLSSPASAPAASKPTTVSTSGSAPSSRNLVPSMSFSAPVDGGIFPQELQDRHREPASAPSLAAGRDDRASEDLKLLTASESHSGDVQTIVAGLKVENARLKSDAMMLRDHNVWLQRQLELARSLARDYAARLRLPEDEIPESLLMAQFDPSPVPTAPFPAPAAAGHSDARAPSTDVVVDIHNSTALSVSQTSRTPLETPATAPTRPQEPASPISPPRTSSGLFGWLRSSPIIPGGSRQAGSKTMPAIDLPPPKLDRGSDSDSGAAPRRRGPRSRSQSPSGSPSSVHSADTTRTAPAVLQNDGSKAIKTDSRGRPRYRVTRSLHPSSDMLAGLPLKPGCNKIEFEVQRSTLGPAVVDGYIYLWEKDARIVISDVDGTITRSDVLGHVLPTFGVSYAHSGVASLFSHMDQNGYKLLYLTSRAVGQSSLTRNYLFGIKQSRSEHGTQSGLPLGPVVLSPDRLLHSFKREVIHRTPQVFKIPALEAVKHAFPEGTNPFWAGFGNRSTDVQTYLAVGVSPRRVFMIDTSSVIRQSPLGDITAAVGHVNSCYQQDYSSLDDMVQSVFPPTNDRYSAIADEYGSFEFWKRSTRRSTLEELDELSDLEEDDETRPSPSASDLEMGMENSSDFSGNASEKAASVVSEALPEDSVPSRSSSAVRRSSPTESPQDDDEATRSPSKPPLEVASSPASDSKSSLGSPVRTSRPPGMPALSPVALPDVSDASLDSSSDSESGEESNAPVSDCDSEDEMILGQPMPVRSPQLPPTALVGSGSPSKPDQAAAVPSRMSAAEEDVQSHGKDRTSPRPKSKQRQRKQRKRRKSRR